MPYLGFKEKPIEISKVNENEQLPCSHTCYFELGLKKYY